MNQLERRLFEMLQVLAGERGNPGKRAVRLDEIERILSQSANPASVAALKAIQDLAEAQGATINEILAELVLLNELANETAQELQLLVETLPEEFGDLIADLEAINTAVAQAETAVLAAEAARDAALTSENSAANFASQSATSAVTAEGSSSEAQNAAALAASSATAAGDSAVAASSSASTASSSATDASQSATAATAAKNDAETALSGAQSAQTSAASSATNAAGSASQASNSATNAANSANTAGNSASAAANSASTASTAASNAETSATAANAQRINAETAASNAGVARDQAVTARDSANDAAALAGERLTVVASITSQGISVLTDQFLEKQDTHHWTRAFSQGSLTRPQNTIYSIGNDWRFVVASGQRDGIFARSDRIIWKGVKNADAFVVEIDFTLESGSLNGAGIWFQWINTSGQIQRVEERLADHLAGPLATGRMMTSRILVKRPAAFSGTFNRNALYVWANNNDATLGNEAKTISFHRVSVRPASATEIESVDVEALITQESIARANADAALATDITTVQTNLNGTNATVLQQANAISTIEGNAAATLAFRVKAGTAGAQLELITASNPSGDTSIARIDATDIVLNGSVTGTMLAFDQGLFNGLQAQTAWIDTLNVAGEAITATRERSNSFTNLPGGGWYETALSTVATWSITVPRPDTVFVSSIYIDVAGSYPSTAYFYYELEIQLTFNIWITLFSRSGSGTLAGAENGGYFTLNPSFFTSSNPFNMRLRAYMTNWNNNSAGHKGIRATQLTLFGASR